MVIGKWFRRRGGGGTPEESEASKLVDRFMSEVPHEKYWSADIKVKDFTAGREVLEQEDDIRREVALEAMQRIGGLSDYDQKQYALTAIVRAVLRRKTTLDADQLHAAFSALKSSRVSRFSLPVGALVRTLEQNADTARSSEAVIGVVGALAAAFDGGDADDRKLAVRMRQVLTTPEDGVRLETAEPWVVALSTELQSRDGASRDALESLVLHAAGASAAKPSKKWLKTGAEVVDGIGAEEAATVIRSVLSRVGQPGPEERTEWYGQVNLSHPTQVHQKHADLLRGLVWLTRLSPTIDLVRTLGDTAETCFHRISGVGPRAPKIGNACVNSLAAIEGDEAIGQLGRLRARVKARSARQMIDRAFEAAADRLGIPVAQLAEIGVPTYGLTSVGEASIPMGDYTAHVVLDGLRKPRLEWIKPDGTIQKSVPAPLKEAHADDIKELKGQVKAIEKALPAQRDRLEELVLLQAEWPFAEFRVRYLDHPLVGALARRLIWNVEAGGSKRAVLWRGGSLIDAGGELVEVSDETRVTPWHPIESTVEEISAWRERLLDEEVRQPYKQAYREIYILTDAERETEIYSNRFAAHVLKQHQFAKLCQQRGWIYTLQGQWDSHNTPYKDVPHRTYRAEFWVDPAAEEEVSGPGIYLYVATDQVRFGHAGDAGVIPLEDVPPVVLSEVFRDVDLFVGVTSVANDPTWMDSGPEGRFHEYWHGHGFGALSPMGNTRSEVLERLLPRLSIASRCRLDGRYLRVEGKLREYKIHLGSANILMEPNDQYLCIVPGRSAGKSADKIFLPFEGDQVLSIILSKAFLLADDDRIDDPTIVSQISR